MISVRRARPLDAVSIGAVHVAAWRSAYPGILPDAYLARMSVPRQAAYYDRAIRAGVGVHVAVASGEPGGPGDMAKPRIVGFASGSRGRGAARPPDGLTPGALAPGAHALGDGEIETLYVLDDWREQGLGRRLLRAAGQHLGEIGCRSAFCWVLRDNPSRWFYGRMGGRTSAEATIQVGGASLVQTAFVWDPIELLSKPRTRLPRDPGAIDQESS